MQLIFQPSQRLQGKRGPASPSVLITRWRDRQSVPEEAGEGARHGETAMEAGQKGPRMSAHRGAPGAGTSASGRCLRPCNWARVPETPVTGLSGGEFTLNQFGRNLWHSHSNWGSERRRGRLLRGGAAGGRLPSNHSGSSRGAGPGGGGVAGTGAGGHGATTSRAVT